MINFLKKLCLITMVWRDLIGTCLYKIWKGVCVCRNHILIFTVFSLWHNSSFKYCLTDHILTLSPMLLAIISFCLFCSYSHLPHLLVWPYFSLDHLFTLSYWTYSAIHVQLRVWYHYWSNLLCPMTLGLQVTFVLCLPSFPNSILSSPVYTFDFLRNMTRFGW